MRYQLHLSWGLRYISDLEHQKIDGKYESVKKMLAKLYGAVSREPTADARQISAADRQIDQLVYGVCGLTEADSHPIIPPTGKQSTKYLGN